MSARPSAQCEVCRANRCAFLCPNCINKVFNDEQRQPIDLLRRQRNSLLESLDQQLTQRTVLQQQEVRRWQLQQELKEAQAKAQRAKDALAQAQQQLQQITASNSTRRHTLEHLNQQTSSARTEVLGNTLPTVLRYQSLTLSHVSAMLAREQRNRVRELTEIFPLRINALRDRGGGPIQITVCNLRIPESGQMPAGGWPEPQSTSAALGYLLLFVDQVALIMGGPMLHESSHQGSTSSIWQPSSFWDRRPPSAAAMLPLHVMTAGTGTNSAAGQAAFNHTTSRYLSTAKYWSGVTQSDSLGASSAASLAANAAGAAATVAYAGVAYAASALCRATGSEGTSPAGAGGLLQNDSLVVSVAGATQSPPQHQQQQIVSDSSGSSSSSGSSTAAGGGRGRQKEGDFKAAMDMLQRSLCCFLKDKAVKNGMQLPAAWNPIAWLAVYSAVVKRDSKQDGKLVAASCRADAVAAAAAAGVEPSDNGYASMATAAGPGAAQGVAGAGRGWTGLEDEDEDEDDDGWGVVQVHLPPPPSQPDAVEHWSRAMFADGNAVSSGQVQGGYGLGLGLGLPRGYAGQAFGAGRFGVAALGSSPSSTGGMLPMERIRSLFGRSE